MTMKSFVLALIGTALLGVAGLVTSTTCTPASACDCTNCSSMDCPQGGGGGAEPYDPSKGGVGFKKSKKKKAKW
jgi:hypothetical protein